MSLLTSLLAPNNGAYLSVGTTNVDVDGAYDGDLAAAYAAEGTGKTYHLASPTYTLDATLQVGSGTHLIGQISHPSTTKPGVKIVPSGVFTTLTNADQVNGNKNISIHGCEFPGTTSGSIDTISFVGASGKPCSGIKFEKVYISEGSRRGVNLLFVKESTFRSSWFENMLVGAYLDSSTDNTFEDCQFYTPDGEGLKLYNSSGGNIVRGCYAFGCTYGFMIERSMRNILANNRSNTNTLGGILLYDGGGTSITAYNVLTGNVCYDSAGAGGIRLDGAVDNLVTGNVCTDSRTGASRTQSYGIRLTTTTARNLVTANLCRNNVTDQILDDGGTGNAIKNNMDDGVFVA